MSKRNWIFTEKFFEEDALKSYVSQNEVSVKRTELIVNGEKSYIDIRLIEKIQKCEFQVKAVFCNSTNEIIISTSNTHDHDQRAPTTREPSPVRNIVINGVAARLIQTQTRREFENQFVGHVSRTQISSLLNYHRSLASSNIYSVNDLIVWCRERCQIPDDTILHKPFVSQFYVNWCNDIFVFITTRQRISIGQLSDLLQVDATFKLNWNNLPVLVFGCSDARRRFYPFGLALIGADEAASSYIDLFKTIK